MLEYHSTECKQGCYRDKQISGIGPRALESSAAKGKTSISTQTNFQHIF